MTSDLKSLKPKITTTYDVGNPGVWDRHEKVAVLNLLIGSQII
jgi:hypothetical protein